MSNAQRGNNNNPNRRQNKVVMFSELKRGTKFTNPITGETNWVNYTDEDCLGIGPANGYTTSYIRKDDELWTKPVDLSLV